MIRSLILVCLVLAVVASAEPRSLLSLEAQAAANSRSSSELVTDMVMRIQEAAKDASRQIAEVTASGGNCDELKPFLTKFQVDLKTLKKEKNAMAVLKDLAEASRSLNGYYRTKMRLADQLALYTAKRFWADHRAQKREAVIRLSIRQTLEKKMQALNKKKNAALKLKKALKKAKKQKKTAKKAAKQAKKATLKAKTQLKKMLKAQHKLLKAKAKKLSKKAKKFAKKAQKASRKAKKLLKRGAVKKALKLKAKAKKLNKKAKKLSKKAKKAAKKAGLKKKTLAAKNEDDVAVIPPEKPVVFGAEAMSVRADMFGFDISKKIVTASQGKLDASVGKLVKPKIKKVRFARKAVVKAAAPTANPFVTADVGTGDYSKGRTDKVVEAGVSAGPVKKSGLKRVKDSKIVKPANKVKAWDIEAINAQPDTTEFTKKFLKTLKPVVNVPAGKLSSSAKKTRIVVPGL